MNHISIGKMLTVTGIPSRHIYLQWEDAIGIAPPRSGNNRQFPEQLVSSLTALQQLLAGLDMPLGELRNWEQRLGLGIPRDEWGMFDLADEYWAKHLRRLQSDMRAATVDLDELLRWEWELSLSYSRNRRGHRELTRDWIRYLQTVQERYAIGWNVYDVRQNLPTPDQIRPQHLAMAHGPEY
jgi:hypothetical protein